MAIGVRASGSVIYDVAAASQTVTKPSGTTTSDVMIMAASIGWGALGGATIITPTGWTAIASNVGGSGTNTEVTSAFYRVFQSGDASWPLTVSNPNGASISLGIALQTFTGVDTTTPIDATGTTSTSTGSATVTAQAVTIATANAWELIAAGTWQNAAMSATGFTALNNGNAAANEQVCLLYNQTPKSVGATGTVTVNGGSATGNSMSAIPFALRPAGGGGSTVLVADQFLLLQAVKRAAYF